MLDPKLGLTVRTRAAISLLVTAWALAAYVGPSAREIEDWVRETVQSASTVPSDPLQAPPSMYAEAVAGHITEGGLDGAQTHLSARTAASGAQRRQRAGSA
jgi:hypothetical protein